MAERTLDVDAGTVAGTVKIGSTQSTTGREEPVEYEGTFAPKKGLVTYLKKALSTDDEGAEAHYDAYVAGIVLSIQQAAKDASGLLKSGGSKSPEEVAAARRAGALKAAEVRKARTDLGNGLATASITQAEAKELAARCGLELADAVLALLPK